MKTSIFTTIRFVLALLTVAAIVAKPYLPPKTLLVHPSPTTTPAIYSTGSDAHSAVRWIDEEQTDWRCDFQPSKGVEGCGMTLTWNPENDAETPVCTPAALDPEGDGWGWENGRSCRVADTAGEETVTRETTARNDVSGSTDGRLPGVDFSDYDGLRVKVHYEGRASYLRIYLRDYDPNSTVRSTEADKFMSAYVRAEDLKASAAYLSLSEFNVPEWWVLTTNAPRDVAQPTFEHVVAVGIGHEEPGVHKTRVERIELVGERISTESFLMAILLLWTGFLLAEGGIRYYRLRRSSRLQEEQIDALASQAEALEQERSTLHSRSITDSLTGVLNRVGVVQQLQIHHGEEVLPVNTGFMILDIDHFKVINDTLGHATGDRILKRLALLLADNIREEDVFGRWGGEEFVLTTPPTTEDRLQKMAEKLRELVATHDFDEQSSHPVTVSIGVTRAQAGEMFSQVFNRADEALYDAKHARNSVVYK